MPKRKIDFEELRTKVRRMQREIAELTPLLESDSPDSDSSDSTSSSVRAFRALIRDEEDKENSENNQSNSEKVQVDPDILDILGIEADKDRGEVASIDEDLARIWQKLVNKGLTKQEKGGLLEEYKRQ